MQTLPDRNDEEFSPRGPEDGEAPPPTAEEEGSVHRKSVVPSRREAEPPQPAAACRGRSVSVVVRFERAFRGQAQVPGLFVRQLGQLHSQLVQVSRRHLLVQLQHRTRTG